MSREINNINCAEGLPDIDKLSRVVVIGTSCAGKTTLAKNIAHRLGTPHIEMDTIFWKPNWQITPIEELKPKVAQIISAEKWVIDGNYSSLRDMVWNRATAVIWLNYSFALISRRAITRTIKRAWTKEILFSDNRETFKQSFMSKDSILLWVLKTYRKNRKEYGRIFRERSYPHLQYIQLTQPQQSERQLQQIK